MATAKALHPPLAIAKLPLNLVFDKAECLEKGGCIKSYYVALRDDEALTISDDKFPQQADALGFIYYTQTNSFFGDWGEIGEHKILYETRVVQFRAPRSAWYKVEMICPSCTYDNKSRFVLGAKIDPATNSR